jgi:hypothetical protein
MTVFLQTVWAGILCDFLTGHHISRARSSGHDNLHFRRTILSGLLEDTAFSTRLRMRFQQDCARPDFRPEVYQWLSENDPGRWIGRGSDAQVSWSARLPDHNHLSFFCGHV